MTFSPRRRHAPHDPGPRVDLAPCRPAVASGTRLADIAGQCQHVTRAPLAEVAVIGLTGPRRGEKEYSARWPAQFRELVELVGMNPGNLVNPLRGVLRHALAQQGENRRRLDPRPILELNFNSALEHPVAL